MTLLIFLTACGSRNFSAGTARKAITSLPQEILEDDDIDIVHITKTSAGSLVAESRVKTAFRLQKIDDEWVVRDIRIGHGQWEKVEDLSEALNRVKTEQTKQMLDSVSEAVREFRKATGSMPAFKDYVALSDTLAPKYMEPLIRLDSWRRPLRATAPDPNSVVVASSGPDGRFDTDDDISVTVKP